MLAQGLDRQGMCRQVVPDVAAAVLQQASAAEPLTYTWYNYTRPAATLPPLEGAAEDAVAGPGAAGTVQASGEYCGRSCYGRILCQQCDQVLMRLRCTLCKTILL